MSAIGIPLNGVDVDRGVLGSNQAKSSLTGDVLLEFLEGRGRARSFCGDGFQVA